jgi:hypothetical protein
VKRRCPLAGHLLVILVRGFTLGRAIELQDGVDADFPDSLGEGGLLCADGEFALVFMTAEFAFDGNMGAFGEGAGEIGQFAEGDASMPLGARFPGSGIVLPGRLGGEREDRDVGCVGSLSFGVAADETDKGDSVEVHTFLLFCPSVSGTRKASGRGSPGKKLLFWGDRNGGARTGRVREQSRSFADAGRRKKPRSSAETDGQDRERDRTDYHLVVGAAVGTP